MHNSSASCVKVGIASGCRSVATKSNEQKEKIACAKDESNCIVEEVLLACDDL